MREPSIEDEIVPKTSDFFTQKQVKNTTLKAMEDDITTIV